MMKKMYLLGIGMLVFLSCFGQEQKQKYTTYYYQRATLFEELPISSSDIVLIGNSLTDGAEWVELLGNAKVKNRGISGDTWEGIYDRLDPVIQGKPHKIFFLSGINDLSHSLTVEVIVGRLRKVAEKLKKELPGTRVYLQSLLPVNDEYGKFKSVTDKGDIVLQINEEYKKLAEEYKMVYVDMHDHFINETGKLKAEYTNDGLHLMGKGYIKWKELIQPYVDEP